MAFNLGTQLNIEEITVNKHGDKIFVSPEDSNLFDNYVKCFDFIIKQSNENSAKVEEIEKKYEGKDDTESQIAMAVGISKVNVDFSESAIKAIDDIFGEGTVKKYFREHYEKIQNFLPGVDCFMDFFEQMSPAMEEIFGKLIKGREKASKERMAKYQPQDHKKPQRKSGSK